MDCSGFERTLTALLTDDVGDDRRRRADELRRHLDECGDCRATRDVVEWAALEPESRFPGDEPGQVYWEAFDRRLRKRIESEDARRTRRRAAVSIAVAVAAVIVVGIGLWSLRSGSWTFDPAGQASGAPGGSDAAVAESSFDPEEILGPDDVDPLSISAPGFDALASGWTDFVVPLGGAETADGGFMIPEIEDLDSGERERLLEWVRQEAARLPGGEA